MWKTVESPDRAKQRETIAKPYLSFPEPYKQNHFKRANLFSSAQHDKNNTVHYNITSQHVDEYVWFDYRTAV